MSPNLQIAFYALWIAHPVLQTAVAAAMLRRKSYRAFPYFFSYIVLQILTFSVIFPIYLKQSYGIFFYAYWTSAAIGVVFGFKVIHEVFMDVFRPYHTLKDLGSVLFKWAGLVMLLVAGVVSASSPVNHAGPIVQAILTLQRSVRVIQCGLVLFLLVFSSYLGISWRQKSFGIALGFGSFAAVELGVIALNASGLRPDPIRQGIINMVAYNIAIIIWFVYALVNSPARDAAANLLRPQRWDQSLTDLQHPEAPESLIPMFEGMVERAFSRTNRYSTAVAQPQSLLSRGTSDSARDEEPALSPITFSSKS